MNPFLVSIIGTLLHMKRVCPQCKREQLIRIGEKHKTVKCRFCGADIPPARHDRASR